MDVMMINGFLFKRPHLLNIISKVDIRAQLWLYIQNWITAIYKDPPLPPLFSLPLPQTPHLGRGVFLLSEKKTREKLITKL